jgi:L-2-hydroxyglutarate oxidase LhgO
VTARENGNQSDHFDIAIVGAGIVGLSVARELHRQHPDISMVILERENDVAQHQSSHNSGVIHSGIYYAPGSLKARLCTEGAKLMYEFCDEHSIPYERCGKLIIALTPSEIPGLDELERRGRENKVTGLRRLTADEIQEVEPECRGLAALYCPGTGIVNYHQVASALASDLKELGVEIRLNHHVRRLERVGARTTVSCDEVSVSAGFVIGCAGLWSDRLAQSAGAPRNPQIVPFRGVYLTLNETPNPIVRGLVYPVPNPELPFLGVHITKLINGDIVLGPTALLIPARDGYHGWMIRLRDVSDIIRWPGTWRMGRRFWRTGLNELAMTLMTRRLLDAAKQYVPAIGAVGVRVGESSGVRAQALDRDGTLVDDFVVSEMPGSIHVRNAPSPAATSALALAREIVVRVHASRDWVLD